MSVRRRRLQVPSFRGLLSPGVILGAAILFGGCGPKPIFRDPGQIATPSKRPHPGARLPSPEPRFDRREPESVRALGDALEDAADPWLGTPYRYGGTSRRGVDCSALAVHLLEEVGVALPRSVREQRTLGKRIDFDQVDAGDLVFFRMGSSRVNHVGIALDDERFVHASRSRGVRIDRLDQQYYRKRVSEIRRVLAPVPSGDDIEASSDDRRSHSSKEETK